MALKSFARVRTSVASAIIAAEVAAGVIALVIVSSRSDASPDADAASSGRTLPSAVSTHRVAPSGGSSSADVEAGSPRLVGWVTRSLPRTTPVLADQQVAADLRLAGFTAVRTPDATAGARFVVATPALRATATQGGAVAALLASSVAVAQAGAGDSTVTVRQVADVSAAALAADAQTRRSSEAELLMNTQITVSEQARQILESGGLDLRSAAALALLASNGPLTVVRIVTDAAEQAAGRPARVIDLRTTWPATVKAMLTRGTSSYRVASITTQPSGAQRLVWAVDVTSGGTP